MSTRKHKFTMIPAAQKALVYAEGKRAFTEGQRRGYNPYTANNLVHATIWWHGWDTGEEESSTVRPGKKKP